MIDYTNYGRAILKRLALVTATILFCAYAGTATAQTPGNPFDQLKTFDGQNRTALAAIQAMIQEAGIDKAKCATIESGLLGVLNDPTAVFAAKQAACKFLLEIGGTAGIQALAQMLPDEKTNDIARYALEGNADPAAGSALIAALRTCTGAALVGVIDSLGDRAEARAVGPYNQAREGRRSTRFRCSDQRAW